MRHWTEQFVEQMGLIVCLSGQPRFDRLTALKQQLSRLTPEHQAEVQQAIRLRFTPTNGDTGCQSATAAVKEACNITASDRLSPAQPAVLNSVNNR